MEVKNNNNKKSRRPAAASTNRKQMLQEATVSVLDAALKDRLSSWYGSCTTLRAVKPLQWVALQVQPSCYQHLEITLATVSVKAFSSLF